MSQKRILPFKTTDVIQALMRVALGEEPADLVVTNADLVNVYTGEIQKNMSVAVKGPWIARVSTDIRDVIGPATRKIDASGRVLLPGLIDGHTHLAWMYTAAEFAPFAAASGVTTLVTETLEPFPMAGLAGVLDFLDSFRGQPVRILATAPVMVSISPAARGIAVEDLALLLERDDVLGLGESYWQAVLQEPEIYLRAMEQTLRSGKVIEGHTAGASEKKLAAYVAAGITSCHEPIDAEQTLSRLRAGAHVMVREGSIRRDLESIARIRGAGVDLRRMVLASDGASPGDLMDGKYMDFVVRKAISCGFAPIEAIQMATLNVAEHFRLDGILGGIAPGRLADMVLVQTLAEFKPEAVLCNGELIFQHGRLLKPPRRHPFSAQSLNTVRLPRLLAADDFSIRLNQNPTTARVRVMEMVSDLVTAERHLDLPVSNGELQADPANGLCKIAAVDRTHHPGKLFTGLIKGFGLTRGAVACSAAWDSSDIVVIGANASDMAGAVNRVAELQGGAVLFDDSRVAAEIALPIFGILCDLSVATLADRLQEFKLAMLELGVIFPDPLLSLITLTGAAIPYLRICEEGLVNLKDGKIGGIFPT
jgi:adenine deaminase